MHNKIKNAIVKKTGAKIEVYKHGVRAGIWVDYSDCNTEYTTDQLIFQD